MLVCGQIVPPAQLLEQVCRELRIAVLDLRALPVRPLGQQVDAFVLDTEARPEREAAFGHGLARVIQHRCARVFHFRCTPARPGQTVILTVARPTFGFQCGHVEGVSVFRLQFQAFRALPRVTDRPCAAIDLAQDVFDQWFVTVDLDVLGQLFGKTEFLGQPVQDGVIR